jgi:non-ribosomal peptide synthetase component F
MLRQFCREQQTTLFVVSAAALNTLMFRYTMQEDILLGIPIADREIKDLAPLIGFLLDTQALRVRMNGNTSFAQLLTDVRQGMLELYAHRAPPFDKVVAALAPQRTLSHSPVFQVMLNWRNREDQPQFLGFPGVVLEPLLAHSQTSKFDLTIVLTDTGGCVLAEVEFSTDLFDESRIARMIGHLHVILNAVVINHDQKLIELPLLTAEERQLLLSDWPQDEEDDGYS